MYVSILFHDNYYSHWLAHSSESALAAIIFYIASSKAGVSMAFGFLFFSDFSSWYCAKFCEIRPTQGMQQQANIMTHMHMKQGLVKIQIIRRVTNVAKSSEQNSGRSV